MPSLMPTLATLGITALIILCSNAFVGAKKIAFQAFFFVSGLIGALTYVFLQKDDLDVSRFFRAFSNLSADVRLALSVLAVSGAYLGGAMYIGGPSGEETTSASSTSSAMPASIDRAVDFVVPEKLAENDVDFFNDMFNK
jgi:hypothetical protein